ncbi:MAG: hypothetical protein RI933_28 [Actinomycetota bacterium]|jgi:uncharacterized membrane protein
MKNPWLLYISIRLGLFIGILVLLIAIGFDEIFAALIAAAVSLAVSLIFFGKQRNALSEAIYNWSKRKDDGDTKAEDGDQ